jgi:hypothetical protein
MATPPTNQIPAPYQPPATTQDRILRLEVLLPEMERRLTERLNAGANKFGALEEQLRPKPRSPWTYIGALFGIVVFVGSIIWQAAKYPDREEFQAANAGAGDKIERLQADFSALQRSQDQITRDVAAIQHGQTRLETSMDKIETKLDRVLRAPR